jgi:hypothetical protein
MTWDEASGPGPVEHGPVDRLFSTAHDGRNLADTPIYRGVIEVPPPDKQLRAMGRKLAE